MSIDLSVHEMLLQLQRGNDEAIVPLYARYARQFFSFTYKQEGFTYQDAEEVVQETFTRILERIQTYTVGRGGGEGWMWTICRNLVVDIHRKRWQLQSLRDLPEVVFPSGEVNPQDWYLLNERKQALECAWDRISEQDRKEILQGKGRGPGRTAWHTAAKQFRMAVEACYQSIGAILRREA